jgi:hypothetical protein
VGKILRQLFVTAGALFGSGSLLGCASHDREKLAVRASEDEQELLQTGGREMREQGAEHHQVQTASQQR